ncbi:hypothetical protein STEG23_004602, partial [Scotinomys teguina]
MNLEPNWIQALLPGNVLTHSSEGPSHITIIKTTSPIDLPKGYGFVDFDSPAAAQKAVASLKANGVQAQMAKCYENLPM